MKNEILKKIFGIIKGIFNFTIVLFVLAFVFIVCLQRFSDNKFSFMSYRMFTVVTGSMEPKYNIGDVLIAKEIEPDKIKIGDTISYLGTVGHFKGKVITHQVVDITMDESGKYLFHSKGIANLVEDPIVHEEQLYGVVIYKTKILSFVYGLIGTKYGMFIFVIVPILYIIVSEMVSTLVEKEEKIRNKLSK